MNLVTNNEFNSPCWRQRARKESCRPRGTYTLNNNECIQGTLLVEESCQDGNLSAAWGYTTAVHFGCPCSSHAAHTWGLGFGFGFENNYFTEICSGSEAGSYLRLIDFVYHSTLGLRVIKKKKTPPPCTWGARARHTLSTPMGSTV